MASGFFENVWVIVSRIPYGKVATYGQIALILGNPRAARTVGWALNSSPREMELPWHRVINSRGRISLDDFHQGGMLQKSLLEQEGLVFKTDGSLDLSVYGWKPQPDEVALN